MTTHDLHGEVLVTWPDFEIDDPNSGRRLSDAGLTIRLAPKTGPRSSTEMCDLVGDSVGVIASTDPFSAEVLSSCRHLKIIARTGVGIDSIDLPAATAAGILVATTRGANEETVADHALALMLSLIRGLPRLDRSIREHRWERTGIHTPRDLCGATVGLVGSGRIGLAVIRRLRAFGSTVLVSDPGLDKAPDGAELADLDDLLTRSDVVSVHAPLTESTRGLIGTRQLALMRSTAVLINTSRGHIIDEEALAVAINNKRLAGAALDVFADEPPFRSNLLELPEVILTPHVAGLSVRAVAEMTRRATTSVLDALRGRVPDDAINPEAVSPAAS